MSPNIARLAHAPWKGMNKGRARPKGGDNRLKLELRGVPPSSLSSLSSSSSAAGPGPASLPTDGSNLEAWVHPSSLACDAVKEIVALHSGKGKGDGEGEGRGGGKGRGKGKGSEGKGKGTQGRLPLLLAYLQSLHSSRLFLLDCTEISPVMAILSCGHASSSKDGRSVTVDRWLTFKSSELHGVLFRRMQGEIEALLRDNLASASASASGAGAEAGAEAGAVAMANRRAVVRRVLLAMLA
jgi:hypothetical protein